MLVLLMKYLVNGDVPNTDLIRRKTITKSSLHVEAIAMYAKLFENDSVGCEENDLIREEEEEHVVSISEQLDRVVAESTQQKDNQPTQRVLLMQDFKLFEATKTYQNGLKNSSRPC